MKSALVHGMIFLGATLLAAQETVAPEVIRNESGVALRKPRILSFNGAVFQVEHADGAIEPTQQAALLPCALVRRIGYGFSNNH